MPDKLSVSCPVSKPIQHSERPVILLTAFLTMGILMMLVRLPFGTGKVSEITVSSQNGVYNLTKMPNLAQSVIHLKPSDIYYPSAYLTPENADRATPTSTEKFTALRADYLSQRFTLLLPDDSTMYTLTFSLSGRHAMCVYVNGKLAGQTGHLGTTKQDTEVWENDITCTAESKGGKMDIILNSAQFYHAKHGASLAELSLTKPALTLSANGEVSSDKAVAEATAALQNTATGGSSVIRTQNAQSIAPETLQSLANTAQTAGGSLVMHADAMQGNTVQGKLYIEPAKLANATADIQLGVYTEPARTAAVTNMFEQYFDNTVRAVALAQQGSFGTRVQIAAKADLTGLNTQSLFLYSYDAATNSYTRITNAAYWIDANGYLHFYTELGGSIIITDKPLARR